MRRTFFPFALAMLDFGEGNSLRPVYKFIYLYDKSKFSPLILSLLSCCHLGKTFAFLQVILES